MISYSDFEKIDLRTGTIIQVDLFIEAKKPAYKLRIDFGEFGILQSSAQITKYYKPENLLNKQIIAVINFPVKQIANYLSQCLVLGIVDNDNGVVLIHPDKKIPNGLKIS